MPYVKGLQVLNDCEENKKMLQKLHWITSRWNRYASKQLRQSEEYPSFKELTDLYFILLLLFFLA